MDREQQRRQQQQQPTALTVMVNELADSMAGQQLVPLSGAVQLQGVTPLPVDSTTEMETSMMETELKQDDVHMSGDDEAPDTEKEVTKGMT